ncbi:hypothetical protein ANCCAN_02333 [Ancylostoma caninum]|uniref:Uncharacterized protein n=1 Tax=Ancylostoma caninum TaxID=29170 RepID=A0A368H8Q9_ANCCA|nr:hypothetical protein ANCCAN_02333 [Ancylostoma caninum]
MCRHLDEFSAQRWQHLKLARGCRLVKDNKQVANIHPPVLLEGIAENPGVLTWCPVHGTSMNYAVSWNVCERMRFLEECRKCWRKHANIQRYL